MGTFQGHALPGAFFAMFSLWWLSQIPRRYVMCRRLNLPFFNTATYPPPKCCSKHTCPAEGIIKVAVTSIGIAAELFAATDYGKAHKIISMGDLQHVTMYLFFLLSGIVDLLTHYKVKVALPGLDYMMATLAFAIEWLLFSLHLYGRGDLDVHLHTLLLHVIAATVGVILLEYKYPHSLMLGLTRCILTLIQGTWFFQVGLILYPLYPSNWKNEHKDIMFSTMLFTWHVAACTIFAFMIFGFLCWTYDKHCASFELQESENQQSGNVNESGNDSEAERDVQYQAVVIEGSDLSNSEDEEESLIPRKRNSTS